MRSTTVPADDGTLLHVGVTGAGPDVVVLSGGGPHDLDQAVADLEEHVVIDWVPSVHAALNDSFVQWIHQPDLFRRLADSTVPMSFIAAQNDIRPSWPLLQLAALVPGGRFEELPDVDHNLWATDPGVWVETVTRTLMVRGD